MTIADGAVRVLSLEPPELVSEAIIRVTDTVLANRDNREEMRLV